MASSNDCVSPVIVVAVTGATRSGKTLLTDKLFNKLILDLDYRVVKILQDRYFLDFHTLTARVRKGDTINWDDPRAIDWDKFYEDIVHQKGLFPVNDDSVKNFLFVEGFMCLYEERLRKLFDVIIWLEIDEQTCFERRMFSKPVTTTYFHTNLWPNYTSYRNLIFKEVKSPVIVIDGALRKEEVFKKVADLLGIKIK